MSLLGLGESCEKISEKYCYTSAGGNWNGERGGEQRDVFVSENRKFLVLFMSKLPLNLRKLCPLPEQYISTEIHLAMLMTQGECSAYQ